MPEQRMILHLPFVAEHEFIKHRGRKVLSEQFVATSPFFIDVYDEAEAPSGVKLGSVEVFKAKGVALQFARDNWHAWSHSGEWRFATPDYAGGIVEADWGLTEKNAGSAARRIVSDTRPQVIEKIEASAAAGLVFVIDNHLYVADAAGLIRRPGGYAKHPGGRRVRGIFEDLVAGYKNYVKSLGMVSFTGELVGDKIYFDQWYGEYRRKWSSAIKELAFDDEKSLRSFRQTSDLEKAIGSVEKFTNRVGNLCVRVPDNSIFSAPAKLLKGKFRHGNFWEFPGGIDRDALDEDLKSLFGVASAYYSETFRYSAEYEFLLDPQHFRGRAIELFDREVFRAFWDDAGKDIKIGNGVELVSGLLSVGGSRKSPNVKADPAEPVVIRIKNLPIARVRHRDRHLATPHKPTKYEQILKAHIVEPEPKASLETVQGIEPRIGAGF